MPLTLQNAAALCRLDHWSRGRWRCDGDAELSSGEVTNQSLRSRGSRQLQGQFVSATFPASVAGHRGTWRIPTTVYLVMKSQTG